MNSRLVLLAALAVPAVLPASPLSADPRDDVRAGSARCDGIADDRTWLDCYYGAAQPLRAKLGLPPAPGAQQALVPPPVPGAPVATARGPAPVAHQGLFDRLLTQTDVKAEPPARMTSYRFDKVGFFTVTLANGEVWKQSTVDAVQAKWHGQPGNYVVTILPGSKMKVGEHETYMVERVR